MPGFNWAASLMGIAVAIVLISLLGWAKLALLIGFVVMVAMGYLIPSNG
jgi:hypothetical protein